MSIWQHVQLFCLAFAADDILTTFRKNLGSKDLRLVNRDLMRTNVTASRLHVTDYAAGESKWQGQGGRR